MLLDHLGSATSIITANDIKQASFDEFGNPSNMKQDTYSFTGYQYDEISQLNYAQARFYDSSLGRFISEDNIINNGIELRGYNRYNYVENNPKKYVDKDGNRLMPEIQPKKKILNICLT